MSLSTLKKFLITPLNFPRYTLLIRASTLTIFKQSQYYTTILYIYYILILLSGKNVFFQTAKIWNAFVLRSYASEQVSPKPSNIKRVYFGTVSKTHRHTLGATSLSSSNEVVLALHISPTFSTRVSASMFDISRSTCSSSSLHCATHKTQPSNYFFLVGVARRGLELFHPIVEAKCPFGALQQLLKCKYRRS